MWVSPQGARVLDLVVVAQLDPCCRTGTVDSSQGVLGQLLGPFNNDLPR